MAVPIPDIVEPLHYIITNRLSGRSLLHQKSYIGGTKAARLANLHIIVFFLANIFYGFRIVRQVHFCRIFFALPSVFRIRFLLLL